MDGLEYVDSKFRLAILAAKRAKQLVGGSKKKVDMRAENPLTIAIEEIKEGKINFHILEESEEIGMTTEEFLAELNDDDDSEDITSEEEVDDLEDLADL